VLAVCASITASAGITWLNADVGTPTLHGSATDNGNGTVTIIGGGDDIWNATDNMHFYYAWASGQTWDAIVEVTDLQGPDYWTKCELMVRRSDPLLGPRGPDAFVAMMACPKTYGPPPGTAAENAVIDQWRTQYGVNADWLQAGANPIPVYPGQWMKIHRDGTKFTIYHAEDAVNNPPAAWTQYIVIDTANQIYGQDAARLWDWGTPFPDIVAVGVGVTAHNDGDLGGGVATIANLSATFPAAAPPSVLGATVQPQNATNYLGSEVSLSFATTNDGIPNVFVPNYQWYKNGTAVTGATGGKLTFLTAAADDGAQVYCKASFPAPSTVSLNSATATVGIQPGSLYYTNGLKEEFFAGFTTATAITNVEAGNVGPANWLAIMPNFDNPGGLGDYYVNRVSGWFIAPASDTYVFFVSADDATDLFLSMDSNPAHKALIAQESGWSGTDHWLSVGGGSTTGQKASYTWSPDNGTTVPWQLGFSMIGGNLYYIEAVHWNGTGGDNVGVTYSTMANVGSLVDLSPSLLQAANHNIVLVTKPVTTLDWVTQPADTTLAQGFSGTIPALAASDSEFVPVYQWYQVSAPAGAIAGATSASLSLSSVTAADNGRQFRVVASTAEGELSKTSTVATLTVVPPVFEKGFAKVEFWANNENLAGLVAGTLGAPTYTITSPRFEASVNNESGDTYSRRVSGFFVPAISDYYVFFICSDDQSDLFISADSDPAGKYMIAQETQWSNPWMWLSSGGASTLTQKRSDSFVDPVTSASPGFGGIYLYASHKYYLEADHQEGGGGDNVEVTMKKLNDADPADGTDSALFGNLIGMFAPFCHYVAFTQQPANVTVPFGGVATLSAAGTTDSKLAVGPTGDPANYLNNYMLYQWAKNGVDIPGATSSAYKFGPVSPVDNGTQFTCKMRAIGYSDASGTALWSNSTPATLTVSGNAVWESGFALHEFWGTPPGRITIESLTAPAPDWMMATPAFEVDTGGGELADNFNDVLLGFFIPPTTGNYVFFCNADDDTDLFLSTDGSASNLRLIARETAWAGALAWGTSAGVVSQVRSDTFVDPATGYTLYANGIHLNAGQKYAMEAVHHQGGGGTETCINAMMTTDPNYPNAPASGSLSVIRGSAVGVYVPPCTYVNVTSQPQNVTVNNYANATFTAGGTTDSTVPVGPEGDWRNSFNNFFFFQWYKNGSPVNGANGPKLVLPMVLPSDNGAQIFCTMRALGYGDASGNPLWATSQVATLTVVTTAPHLLYAAVYTNYCPTNLLNPAVTYVDLAFDNPMDPAKLILSSSYNLPAGLTIVGINFSTNDLRSVELAVTGTPHPPFSVSVNSSLTDLGHTALASGSTATNALAVPLTVVDVGTPDSGPVVPSMVYVDGPKDYTVVAEGRDIWDAADGFNFCYELKTGDFDVAVRVKDVTHTSNWSKAGLMVRDTIGGLYAGARNWNVVCDPRSDDGIMALDNTGYGANTIECNCRSATDATSGGWQAVSNQVAPPYPNAWVRLKRTGTILTAFNGTNGVNWVQMGWADPTLVGDPASGGLIPLPNTVYVGICTTAHNNDNELAGDPVGRFYDTVHYADYATAWALPVNALFTVQHVGQNFILSWTPPGGTLQSSPALGPNADWQPIPSATSPMTIPIGAANQFYRIKY
jgi:hypothetical protein